MKYNNVYKELYVSKDGSDDGDGSKDAPFKTIKRAKEETAIGWLKSLNPGRMNSVWRNVLLTLSRRHCPLGWQGFKLERKKATFACPGKILMVLSR